MLYATNQRKPKSLHLLDSTMEELNSEATAEADDTSSTGSHIKKKWIELARESVRTGGRKTKQ